MFKNFVFDVLFATEGGGPAIEEGSLSVSDVIDIMNTDDDPADDDKEDDKEPVKTKETKTEEKEEKPKDDDDEDEVELEDVDEVEVEDIPRRQEILKAYPDLFKKFPGIQKAIYREQQFSEIFPTVTEAKSAVESVKQYQQFESALLSGDLGSVLKAVKQADGEAFAKIGDNILPILASADKEVYNTVINDVLRHAIFSMASEGNTSNNEELKIAASIINEFVFGSKQIRPPANKQQAQPNNEQLRFQQERQQFHQQQIESVVDDISSKAKNTIKATIEKNLDPKDSMTSYVKNKALNDASERVEVALLNDKRYMNMIDNLYAAAAKSGFDNASRTKIKNAIYSKAKTILPDIIREVRAEALKGSSSRVKDVEESPKAKQKTESRPDSIREDKSKPGRHEKTLDFFMRD